MRIAVCGLAATALPLLSFPAAASAGEANACNTPVLNGPGPSEWFTGSFDGTMFSARLRDPNRLFSGPYGRPHIGDNPYENPDVQGCTTQGNERNYPADIAEGLIVKPKIYVSKRRPFARILTVITNPGDNAATFLFNWFATVDQDFAEIGASSSNDREMDATDRWATTCQDAGDDGCSSVENEGANRAAELAHNWEGRGRKKHSADFVADLSQSNFGSLVFEFANVRVGPGKTVTFMQTLSMARTIRAANKAARKIDRKPRKYGVFKGMSKREIRKLQNWNPKQAKKPKRKRRG